jgi:hypothetical protein
MASIRREVVIDVAPDVVWEGVRDWGALHKSLAPGFVLDTRLDGGDRLVTFASGVVLREILVDLDDEARRLVWSVVDGPYTHHNGSAEVFAEGDGTRFVWTADLLPNELAGPTAEAMEQGTNAIKKKFEGHVAK